MGSGFYDAALIALLKQHGCTYVRQGKGSHEIWYSPNKNYNFPVSRNMDSRHMAKTVLKQAGIPEKF